MKPAAEEPRAISPKRLFKVLTRVSSIVALSIGAISGQATAKTLPTSALQNLHSTNLSSHVHVKHSGLETKTSLRSRLNSLFKATQNPGGLLEQALSWPPQFAIGQTWKINIVGVGNWTLPLTTTVAGDATGYTTGTDKREGYFKYFAKTTTSSDFIANYLDNDTESYVCTIFPNGNPNGNTLNGVAFRIVGKNDPVDLKTSCSATLGADSSNTNTSPFVPSNTPNVPLNPNTTAQNSSLAWPPQLAVGQNWDYRLGTRPVVYHGNFSSIANDVYKGDLITDGTGDPIAKRALSVVFSAKDDALISFAEDPQGGITGCLFTGKASLQNNAYVGSTLFRAAGAKDFVNQNTDCRMNAVTTATSSNSGNFNPVWPPKPSENWTVTIDGLTPWIINFEKLDQDGDPTGTGTQNGASFTVYAFKDTGVAGVFQMANRQTGESYFCIFKTLQVQGNAFVGGIATNKPKGGQSSNLNKSCTASNGSISASNQTSPFANPSQTPSLNWPPAIAIGQTWSFAIQGGGSWSITLEKVSSVAGAFSGSVNGTDVRSTGLIGYDTQNDQTVAAVFGATDTMFCLVEKSGFSGSSLKGDTYRSVNNANPTKTGTACTISPVTAASATTGGTTLGGLFGNTGGTPTGTVTGLSWPVQVAVGQIWSVNVNKILFQLKLERVNNGITIGTASSSSGELAGGFVTQGDNLSLVLTDGTATITCTFGRSSIQGQTLNGQAKFTEKPNAPEQSLGACSATLAPRVSTNADPLDIVNPFKLESQQDLMLKPYSSLQ